MLDAALEGGEGSASRPGSFLPPGKTRFPLYRRLGGPQGRSGQARKISPPPGFDPRAIQPVASRYTDWATRPTSLLIGGLELLNKYDWTGNTWYLNVLLHFCVYEVVCANNFYSKCDQTLHSYGTEQCLNEECEINTRFSRVNTTNMPRKVREPKEIIEHRYACQKD